MIVANGGLWQRITRPSVTKKPRRYFLNLLTSRYSVVIKSSRLNSTSYTRLISSGDVRGH